jgi:hypothetical protein
MEWIKIPPVIPFTLRKDVVLNGMIIAIETWNTIALSEISITSSFCAPT